MNVLTLLFVILDVILLVYTLKHFVVNKNSLGCHIGWDLMWIVHISVGIILSLIGIVYLLSIYINWGKIGDLLMYKLF